MPPPQGCDERAAWESNDEFRVEGAAFEGRPVSFCLLKPDRWQPPYVGWSSSASLVRFWLWLPALIGGIALARRNLTRGRGDWRAAARLALVVVLGQLAAALLRANHTNALLLEQRLFEQGMSSALYGGALVGLLYLALEPYVRRVWPIIWFLNRLLSGAGAIRWSRATSWSGSAPECSRHSRSTRRSERMLLHAPQAFPHLELPDASGLLGRSGS
jgi:hypothetical protein